MEEHYTEEEKAKLWIKLLVIPTISPVAFSYAHDLIVGYSIEQTFERHILELILIIFALAVSIFASSLDLERKISQKLKNEYAIASVGYGAVCIVIYCCLYNKVEGISFCVLLLMHLFFVFIIYKIIKKGYSLESETPIP